MTSLPAAEPHATSAPAHRRRAVAVLGAVSAGLFVLSACDKPTPVATITVGTDSVHSEASCYEEDKALKATELEECLKDKDIESIGVDPDEVVRFGVDKKVADEGWTVLLNGQPVVNEPFKKSYVTLPGNAFFNPQYGAKGDETTVSIVEGDGKDAHGLWSFKFKKES